MEPPVLSQFRIEPQASGLVHLVFDCPGRSMNVFSDAAIADLGKFAEWLPESGARGVVVRSGKPSGLCAGADLGELGLAYEMIVAAAERERFDLAYDHFFRLSHALRRIETAGVPVAAAIAGVALGGGCELALGCHYRVATTAPKSLLGLPECGVGLLPGAGGTQRMPRLVGLDLGLEVLLRGRTLHGEDARAAGLIDTLVEPGEEVAAAEAWLLSGAAQGVQPWDAPDARPLAHAAIDPALERERTRELERMLGREPAPLAILDCLELGLIQPIDGAIRSEMAVFARLIQRPEPRNMIRALFLGKQAWDKARRDGTVTPRTEAAVDEVAALMGGTPWQADQPDLLAAIRALLPRLSAIVELLDDGERLQLDHAVVASGAVPAYLGGATGLLALG